MYIFNPIEIGFIRVHFDLIIHNNNNNTSLLTALVVAIQFG